VFLTRGSRGSRDQAGGPLPEASASRFDPLPDGANHLQARLADDDPREDPRRPHQHRPSEDLAGHMQDSHAANPRETPRPRKREFATAATARVHRPRPFDSPTPAPPVPLFPIRLRLRLRLRYGRRAAPGSERFPRRPAGIGYAPHFSVVCPWSWSFDSPASSKSRSELRVARSDVPKSAPSFSSRPLSFTREVAHSRGSPPCLLALLQIRHLLLPHESPFYRPGDAATIAVPALPALTKS